MFTIAQRDHLRDYILDIARADPRVTAGALTGSMALDAVDERSDVDVAVGIAEGTSLEAVLDDWTGALDREFGVLHYWDLPFRSSLYRVFLLPGGLELDIGLSPQHDFGPRGPRFRTLFGTTRQQESSPPAARYLIGLCWHHVFHARSSIERGKPWRAEYWISALRDHTLALACLRLGEEHSEARGVDRLPTAVTEPLAEALVRSLNDTELRRALAVATRSFITELEEQDPALCARLTPLLQEFGAPQSGSI
ncbi:MAG TPA: hypothetical protein VEY08_17620 [Chloroflexia bacterium]|nr:hypothetical protein [Chloroflexia bacterium]